MRYRYSDTARNSVPPGNADAAALGRGGAGLRARLEVLVELILAATVASERSDTSMSTAVSSPGSTVTDVSPLSSDTGAAATV